MNARVEFQKSRGRKRGKVERGDDRGNEERWRPRIGLERRGDTVDRAFTRRDRRKRVLVEEWRSRNNIPEVRRNGL